MLLFVGLGNPSPNSENNRHNIGFKIIDAINQKFGLSKQNQNLKDCLQLEQLMGERFMQLNHLRL